MSELQIKHDEISFQRQLLQESLSSVEKKDIEIQNLKDELLQQKESSKAEKNALTLFLYETFQEKEKVQADEIAAINADLETAKVKQSHTPSAKSIKAIVEKREVKIEQQKEEINQLLSLLGLPPATEGEMDELGQELEPQLEEFAAKVKDLMEENSDTSRQLGPSPRKGK